VKLSESGFSGLKDFQDLIFGGMWGFLYDRKANLNIHIKNDKLPSCTSSNPGYPDSDNKNFQ
jgi:hypothetical protein